MVDQDAPDPQFDAMTSRLLRREVLRRAAEELNAVTVPGLQQALARVSAEVTQEAASRASLLVLLHDATSSSSRTDQRLPATDAAVD